MGAERSEPKGHAAGRLEQPRGDWLVEAERKPMEIEVLNDPDAVARQAAALVAADARAVVAKRGRFAFALSGGKTPWLMLRALANENVPWDKVHLFQMDERVAPAGHSDRNFTHLRESLL